MFRSFPVMVATVLVGSYADGHAKPPAAIIDQIETKLANDPCVGTMDKWVRRYGFRQAVNQPPDRNDIRILLSPASPVDPAGRFISENTDYWPTSDDREKMVFGKYDIRLKRLTVEHCGDNWGPPQAERDIR